MISDDAVRQSGYLWGVLMTGDLLFAALYFPVAMVLAIAGMVWRVVWRALGGTDR